MRRVLAISLALFSVGAMAQSLPRLRMHELPTVTGGSDLKIDRITHTNHLVGSVRVGTQRMGFMWRPGEAYRLIAPTLSSSSQIRIADISTSGRIVAVQNITNNFELTDRIVVFEPNQTIWYGTPLPRGSNPGIWHNAISFAPNDRIYATISQFSGPNGMDRIATYDSPDPTYLESASNGRFAAQFDHAARPWVFMGMESAYDASTNTHITFSRTNFFGGPTIDYLGRFTARLLPSMDQGVFNDAGQLVSTYARPPLFEDSISPRLGLEWHTYRARPFTGAADDDRRVYAFTAANGLIPFESLVENFPSGSFFTTGEQYPGYGLWTLRMNRNDYGYGYVDGRLVAFAPVPEPASMIVLGTGLVALLRRRRTRKACG